VGKANRPSPYDKIYAYEVSDDLRQREYMFERFSGINPTITTTTASLTALPTAVAGQVNKLVTPLGFVWEVYQTTAQSLQPAAHTSKGMVLDGDQVSDESAEFVPGGNHTSSPYAMVVGTDSDFFFRCRLEITDASGSDQLIIGWRKQQTYQVPTSFLTGGAAGYTDFAAIGFAATKADPNPISITTSIGGAVNVVTPVGFTWADTLVHELEVRVIGGRAIYLINGNRIGNPIAKDALGAAITSQSTVSGPAYTFTSALTLVPFIFVRQDVDLTDAVYLREAEVGHLTQRGLDPNNE
jgi:hypothetical protein